MFTSVGMRSASAYHTVDVETAVSQASPHQLVNMLFDRLLQAVSAARYAMGQGDVVGKGKQIIIAVRILEEGLKPALNLQQGGELALNLHRLYGYCVERLTHANLKSDDAALGEVIRLIEPLSQGWKQIAGQATNKLQ